MQNPVFIDAFIRYSELVSNLSLPVNIIKKAVDCKIQVLAILLRKSYSKLNHVFPRKPLRASDVIVSMPFEYMLEATKAQPGRNHAK